MLSSLIEQILAGLSVLMTLATAFFAYKSSEHKKENKTLKVRAEFAEHRSAIAEQQNDAVTEELETLVKIDQELNHLRTKQKEAVDASNKNPVDRNGLNNSY